MSSQSLPVTRALTARPISPATLARFALAGIVVVSFGVRFLAALERVTPRYLPDEYLYTQLARSLADGRGVSVLGQSADLPALLQPLLAAPLAMLGDPELAFRATQGLNALAMALAAIPIFWLARFLRLSHVAALWCAAAAAAAPSLLYASYVTADALGYLLALVAVAAGARALVRPTGWAQCLFLVAAGVATFARVQYVILVGAFALAALLLERGRPIRTARRFGIVTALFALSAITVLVMGRGSLGRYAAIGEFGASLDTARWLGSTAFLLVLAVGAATAPGAVAWCVARVRDVTDRQRAAFACLLATTTISLVVAAAVMTTGSGSDRFLERYLVVLLPLFALAFAAWIADDRPARPVVVALAVVLVVVMARLPLSGYATGQGLADSPTLLALDRLAGSIGVGGASLAAALIVTATAGAAVVATRGRQAQAWIAGVVTLCTLVPLSVGAHAADISISRSLAKQAFAGSPNWVDETGARDVLLVQTPWSSRMNAMLTGAANGSITAATSLGGFIDPFDGLGAPLELRPDGTLLDAGEPVRRPLLFATSGTSVVFGDARVTSDTLFALAVPADEARLRALAIGVRGDGSLARFGRIHAFPTPRSTCTRATVTVRLPQGFPGATLETTRADGSRARIELSKANPRVTIAVASTATAGRWIDFRALGRDGRPVGPMVGAIAAAWLTSTPVSCPQ